MALNAGVVYPPKKPALNAGAKYPPKPAAAPVLNAGVVYPNKPSLGPLNAGVTNSKFSGISAINGAPTAAAASAAKPNTNWQTSGSGAGVPGHVGRPNDPFSLQNTGQFEDAFQLNQDKFWAPGQSAGVWGAAKDAYQNRAPHTNYAETEYKRFAGGAGAGLDPYYDRARERLTEGIDNASAARGMYDSSETMRATGDGLASLNAEQANREADYDLRRDEQQFGMAHTADATGIANSGEDRGWLGAFANAGFGADSNDLSRTTAGLSAAADAQNAREGRIGSALGALGGYTGALNDQLGSLYDAFVSGDQDAFDTIQQALLGVPFDRRNANIRAGEDWNKDTEHVTNTATKWTGMGMGG